MSSPYWKNKEVAVETAKVVTTGPYVSADLTNQRTRGLMVALNTTAFTGTSYLMSVEYKDVNSGVYTVPAAKFSTEGPATLAQTAAAATDFAAIVIHPDMLAVAAAGTAGAGSKVYAANAPTTFRIRIVYVALTTHTFNLSVHYLV